MTTIYPMENWLNDTEALAYADYWNDESHEKDKPFWILDGDFGKMERYLASILLVEQLEACVVAGRRRFGRQLGGAGCDLAAGCLWAEPHLFRLGTVDRIHCVEYSRHRLLKLGPAVLEHYNVAPHQVVLALGDFHRLQLPDRALDFVFMSSAFHHSDDPDRLLYEIGRILKPDGIVVLIGEHVGDLGLKGYIRQPAKWLISKFVPAPIQQQLLGRTLAASSFRPDPQERLGTDAKLGDHVYTRAQYAAMFSRAGFRFVRLRHWRWPYQAFVLAPGPEVA